MRRIANSDLCHRYDESSPLTIPYMTITGDIGDLLKCLRAPTGAGIAKDYTEIARSCRRRSITRCDRCAIHGREKAEDDVATAMLLRQRPPPALPVAGAALNTAAGCREAWPAISASPVYRGRLPLRTPARHAFRGQKIVSQWLLRYHKYFLMRQQHLLRQ